MGSTVRHKSPIARKPCNVCIDLLRHTNDYYQLYLIERFGHIWVKLKKKKTTKLSVTRAIDQGIYYLVLSF